MPQTDSSVPPGIFGACIMTGSLYSLHLTLFCISTCTWLKNVFNILPFIKLLYCTPSWGWTTIYLCSSRDGQPGPFPAFAKHRTETHFHVSTSMCGHLSRCRVWGQRVNRFCLWQMHPPKRRHQFGSSSTQLCELACLPLSDHTAADHAPCVSVTSMGEKEYLS